METVLTLSVASSVSALMLLPSEETRICEGEMNSYLKVISAI